jgi:hypothetical protein
LRAELKLARLFFVLGTLYFVFGNQSTFKNTAPESKYKAQSTKFVFSYENSA